MTDLGEITKCYTVTFHRRSKHPAERLWSAITEADEIAKWMGSPARVDLRVGGDYIVDFQGEGEGSLDGVIVRVETGRRLGYVWGWSYIEWSIEDGPRGCSYTFVQNGLADRGEDEEGLPAGWHSFLDRLGGHLDGVYLSKDHEKQRWESLKPGYRKQLDAIRPLMPAAEHS
jgi:uncharacterized protein YndB with AHSA1/START domain